MSFKISYLLKLCFLVLNFLLFSCQLCDETFTCAKQLSAHEKKEHGGNMNKEIFGFISFID